MMLMGPISESYQWVLLMGCIRGSYQWVVLMGKDIFSFLFFFYIFSFFIFTVCIDRWYQWVQSMGLINGIVLISRVVHQTRILRICKQPQNTSPYVSRFCSIKLIYEEFDRESTVAVVQLPDWDFMPTLRILDIEGVDGI
jgi:hypothetical protein